MTVKSIGGDKSGWDLGDAYARAITTADILGKLATSSQIALKYLNVSLSKGTKDTIRLAKLAKVIKVPKIIAKLSQAKTKSEAVFIAIALYFTLFDFRNTMKWVPNSELPLTAVLGLGRVELFRQSLKNYNDLLAHKELALVGSVQEVDKYKELALVGSVQEVDKYIRDLSRARYDACDDFLAMVSSLCLGAKVFFPKVGALTHINNAAKLGSLALPFLLVSIK